MIVSPAAKNAASKSHPKDILCYNNHLYRIVLVLLALNIVFTAKNNFKWLDIDFFKNCKDLKFCQPHSLTHSHSPTHSLTHSLTLSLSHSLTYSLTHTFTQSLTDHSRKARDQMKQCTATILWHKNKLTGGMYLLRFWRACSFCASPFLYVPLGHSSLSSKTISMCYFLQSALSLSSISRCHNII